MDAKVLLGWEREYSINTRPSAGVAADLERAVYAIFDDFDENQDPRFSRLLYWVSNFLSGRSM